MGLDFIEKTKKAVRKKWDRARVKLATADLLTRNPERVGCSTVFELAANARLSEGDCVTVEAKGSSLVARRGLSVVAHAPQPPPQVLQAVKDSCGIAQGTVERVHRVASVVEILSC